jgi:hypothetical protein
MPQINKVNVPAYQRKRSLAAKARKKPAKKMYKRKTQPVRTIRRVRTVTPAQKIEEIPISEIIEDQETFENPLDIFNSSSPSAPSSPGCREMKICGHCDGYFDNIQVAVVKVTSPIRIGDIIIFEKDGGLFEQEITSMQINRKDVSLARSGSDIGLKINMKPTVGTLVYKVI